LKEPAVDLSMLSAEAEQGASHGASHEEKEMLVEAKAN